MKIKVLGSSSKGNCYLLESEKETLILECGISYRDILKGLEFNLRNIAGCLVTHCHKDHSKSMKDLLKAGINIYTSEGTTKTLSLEHYRIKHIKPLNQFKIGKYIILPFETQHDCEGSMGFLIQHKEMGKMLFITDSYYCKYKFKGLDHIFIECNYSNPILEENLKQGCMPIGLRNRLIKSHFSLENVKEFLKANDLNKVKEIVLIHLSDGNSNAEQFKKEIESLTGKQTYIADKGLEIDLSKF